MSTALKRIFVFLLVIGWVALATGCAAGRSPMESQAEPGAEEPAFDAREPVESDTDANGADVTAVDLPRMIIYTGELSLVVDDVEVAQSDAVALVKGAGGYVAAAESYAYNDGLRRITLTLRVPAEAFNATMEGLRELALEIRRDSISSQDVTQEYVDLSSRLTALEAKADRLEELMEEAEDTEAVLAVYEELSETQIQIEETKGRMRYLERRSDMATITVELIPDALSRPVEVAGWRPQGTVKRAIEMLIEIFQFLLDALIWIILVVVPVLAFIGLVIYGVIRLLMLIFGRGKKKEKAESKEASTDQS
ncbi:MAG: DUF4349 domain-containing protein [Anaerolineae bacterium]